LNLALFLTIFFKPQNNFQVDAMNNRKAMTKTIIWVVVLLVILYGLWRIVLFLPIIPHKVTLPTGDYLPAPSVYLHDSVNYDPLHPPLESKIMRIHVDRSAGQLVFYFLTGEIQTVPLGKAGTVTGCEHQFSMEYFPLPIQELQLGSVLIQEPILMVSCEMWARGEKIRPAKLILRQGPLPQGDTFNFGPSCKQPEEICLYFGQEYGILTGDVMDAQSGKLLPEAQIVLTNEMGIQEFTGQFQLPLYAGLQMKYQISAPGYPDLTGEISNSYAIKLFIDTVFPMDQASGYSYVLEMPAEGLDLNFSFRLGATGPDQPLPISSPTSLPTAPGTATPVP
jgi:hypothetical protein